MAPKDTEEKMDVEPTKEKGEEEQQEKKAPTFRETLLKQLEDLSTVKHSRDYRPVLNILRRLTSLRRTANLHALSVVVNELPADNERLKEGVAQICSGAASNPQEDAEPEEPREEVAPTAKFTSEVEIFLWLLAALARFDAGELDTAKSALEGLFHRAQVINKRTLDPISAKAFYFYSLIYEKLGRETEIRSLLLSAHRTSSLRKDELGEATMINLIVRNYLRSNLVEQASKFVSKATFPENSPNSEWARNLYYLGRIKAVQLDYSGAYGCLVQALRKAPQPPRARGFRADVQKLSCIVQLLMGEIPQRESFFTQEKAMNALTRPYFELVAAVRNGNLLEFQETVQRHKETFDKDANTALVARLRHNVIKVGLRNINLAYSRISFDDICKKSGIESRQDAESIVAKAIRDGVIDAVIDHQEGCIRSREIGDIYSTTEPQNAFRKRIDFCMQLHNDAIKAMKYPPKKGHDLEKMEKHLKEQIDDAELIDELLDDSGEF